MDKPQKQRLRKQDKIAYFKQAYVCETIDTPPSKLSIERQNILVSL